MRVMALDFGTKTIGLAVTDELHLTAQGLTTYLRQGKQKDLDFLKGQVSEYGVSLFVLGLPINMNGSEGPRAQATREFGSALQAHTGIAVDYSDERLTTAEANRVLLTADASRKKRREVVDQLAASIILQGWMLKNPKNPAR